MVTCCDYIYILCGDTYIMNVTERQMFWRSPSTARTRTIGTKCFVFFFVFSFLFTVVCEQGLKLYTPQATLLTTSSLLRHEENLVPLSSGANFEYV